MTIAGTFISATQAAGDSTEVIVNRAFIQGFYWAPDMLPGWGFFVDLQEDRFFGALFGYLDGQASFITMQGASAPGEILTWQGEPGDALSDARRAYRSLAEAAKAMGTAVNR